MRRGLTLCFDEAFDGPSWPGPLGEREAVFGEAWLGPMGLLGVLETALGLGAPHASQAERIARLVPALYGLEGFWSRSLEADALGTARRVLEDRDALRLCGWRGQAPSPRLEQLALATRDVVPGAPDRLEAVARALEGRSSGIESVELLDAEEDLAAGWRDVLRAMARRGTELRKTALSCVEASGDLAGARSAGFSPRGDGSLQLVRAQGPLTAADDLAAWIAANDDLGRAVVIGADATLDRALRRHGLPLSGASADGDVMLQALALVTEMGWSPADPRLAHQLLMLPGGPVPAPLQRPLARALQRGPAVGSDGWGRALAVALEEIEGEALRGRAAARVAAIFDQAVSRQREYPIGSLQRRIALVREWVDERLEQECTVEASLRAVAEQCAIFARLLEVLGETGRTGFSAPELRRALELASEGVSTPPPCEREAGFAQLRRPDAVGGPADTIVWWQFERRSAPVPHGLRLNEGEKAALRREGVSLPRIGRQAIWLARRWRRPLEQACGRLLLVCPQRGEDGEALYPHPLWEEIEAQLDPAGRADLSHLVATRPDALASASSGVQRVRASWLAPPKPRRRWRVFPETVVSRQVESPSGMEKLIACPLAWALRYVAELRPGAAQPPPGVSSLSLGKLAHDLLHRLLVREPLLEPDAAAREAVELLAAEGPRLMAALFLPEYQLERSDARPRIAEAARVLFAQIRQVGARVQSSEERYEGRAGTLRLAGTPDLVLCEPQVVVDLKWGGRTRHREALATGTAVQLAAYSFLLSPPFPPVAYFVLRTHELMSAQQGLFADAVAVDAPRMEATWEAALATYWHDLAQMREGLLTAAGVEATEKGDAGEIGEEEAPVEKAALDAGRLALPAPCHFCDYGLLCGRDLA